MRYKNHLLEFLTEINFLYFQKALSPDSDALFEYSQDDKFRSAEKCTHS